VCNCGRPGIGGETCRPFLSYVPAHYPPATAPALRRKLGRHDAHQRRPALRRLPENGNRFYLENGRRNPSFFRPVAQRQLWALSDQPASAATSAGSTCPPHRPTLARLAGRRTGPVEPASRSHGCPAAHAAPAHRPAPGPPAGPAAHAPSGGPRSARRSFRCPAAGAASPGKGQAEWHAPRGYDRCPRLLPAVGARPARAAPPAAAGGAAAGLRHPNGARAPRCPRRPGVAYPLSIRCSRGRFRFFLARNAGRRAYATGRRSRNPFATGASQCRQGRYGRGTYATSATQLVPTPHAAFSVETFSLASRTFFSVLCPRLLFASPSPAMKAGPP
jgi:hypothetical protein